MQWQEVIDNPYLRNLPFKIELNQWGKVEMSPASNRHALLQSRLAQMMRAEMGRGETLTEASIQTANGVRVPDVVWASDDFLDRHGAETPFTSAPEICVEVVSPSNARGEMLEKIVLYLEAGATEVWLVTETGGLEVHDAMGLHPDSRLIPDAARLVAGMTGKRI